MATFEPPPNDPAREQGETEKEPRVASDPMAPADVGGEAELGSRPRVEPVSATERIASIDVVRGVAVLGILAMNIVHFGWPFAAYDNPDLSGGPETWNRGLWLVNHVLFSGKMLSLFSMLFGAGLVLMADRAEARGATIRGVYYRRILWLLVFGLIHAYLIWAGDILYAYAMCGLLLYLFRRKSPTTLLIVGVIVLLCASTAMPMVGAMLGFVERAAVEAEAIRAAGKSPNPLQHSMLEIWDELRPVIRPTEQDLTEEIAVYRSDYLSIVRHRAPEVFAFQTLYFLFLGLWAFGGRMLIGMALMKWRVFSAEKSTKFYVIMALLGYGIGLPLTIYAGMVAWSSDFDPILHMRRGMFWFDLGTVPTALGHAAVVILIVKAGAISWMTNRLAAVGRMALTNYLMQSLICATLFYGYGLSLFGRLDRFELWMVVLAIWALQLWYSPLWLSRYRFGPAEWLWRSLTYWRPQPLRKQAEGE